MMSDDSLLDLCRSLVSTVRSGLTLSDAFDTLSRSPRHGRVIKRAAELVGKGKFLHEAFAAQGIFPPVFTALLRAGEEGGKIDDFLEIYADCLEVRIKFRRQIERLLVYPVFILVFSGALFMAVSFKVVPLVMEPLIKSGAALPPQAFFFTSLAEWLYASWYKILAVGVPAILLLRALLNSGPGRKLRGLAGHWLPLFRFASEEGRLYYIYTTISLLLKAGLLPGAMMEVLMQFSQDDLVTRRRLRRAAGLLAGGTGFAASISGLLPEDDRRAMEIAEKAGRLDDTLLSRAKLHYDRHIHRMKLLVTGFNIATLAAIAAVCFGLIMTVAWPVVSMMSGTKEMLKGLGLGTQEQAVPAGRGQLHRKTRQPGLSAAELKTKAFNAEYAGKVADVIKQYGAAPEQEKKEEPAAAEEPQTRKKLKGRMKFGSPTSIEPTSIGGQ